VLIALLAACGGKHMTGGGDGGTNSLILTILGPSQVMLPEGANVLLGVAYHDETGRPAMGTVSFALSGSAAGAQLNPMQAPTDPNGVAQFVVTAGRSGTFGVTASAPDADMATWNIQVAKQQTGPLTFAGTYHLESTLDVATALSGSAGSGSVGISLADLEAMTDDPNDPAKWLLDQMVDHVGDLELNYYMLQLRPSLDGYLNDRLLAASPGLKDDLNALRTDLAAALQRFGLGSDLVITPPSDGSSATIGEQHTVRSVIFNLGTNRREVALSDMQVADVMAANIAGSLQMDRTLGIGQHSVQLPWGKLLQAALERVIIPSHDAQANSLATYLQHEFSCSAVQDTMLMYLEVPGVPDYWNVTCQGTLSAAAGSLLTNFQGGGNARFDLQGTAMLVDRDTNGTADLLDVGRWTGQVKIGGRTANLVSGPSNAFLGSRSDMGH
jgi:hypothetical protein